MGYIKEISFGFGGYQDAQFGLIVVLGGKNWGVNDFKGAWPFMPKEGAQWTVEDRNAAMVETVLFIRDRLSQAGKQRLEQLVGVPVMCNFDGPLLRSWRILDEVLP
jgi:hypothetical protein